MKEDTDKTEDTLYAINCQQNVKIFEILEKLDIKPRKRQNIKHIDIMVEISYYPQSDAIRKVNQR